MTQKPKRIATQDEVEHLKKNWTGDPCYDITIGEWEFETEIADFTPFHAELQEYADKQKEIWTQQRNQRDQTQADRLGMNLEQYREYDSLLDRSNSARNSATQTLQYYFEFALILSSDNRAEIEGAIEAIVDAAILGTQAELFRLSIKQP